MIEEETRKKTVIRNDQESLETIEEVIKLQTIIKDKLFAVEPVGYDYWVNYSIAQVQALDMINHLETIKRLLQAKITPDKTIKR